LTHISPGRDEIAPQRDAKYWVTEELSYFAVARRDNGQFLQNISTHLILRSHRINSTMRTISEKGIE